MNITTATFECSSQKIGQCPDTELPEFAFIGRSNVGKSSLINMLTGHGSLAKVSSTPGKTRLINHFLINKNWYLVDLPGYGYARVSKDARKGFSKLITNYVSLREALVCLFVLVDSRHDPQKNDLDFINMLGEKGVPFALIFTKSDKISKNALDSSMAKYAKKLSETWEEMPPMLYSSSEKFVGKDEILNFIDECITRWSEPE
ncbi:MAG: ribosome biogenesis GTP-binding protein YihA/YsxC [Rikenellaceae bacterium]